MHPTHHIFHHLILRNSWPALQEWTQGKLSAAHGDLRLHAGGLEFALKVTNRKIVCRDGCVASLTDTHGTGWVSYYVSSLPPITLVLVRGGIEVFQLVLGGLVM